MVAKGDLAGVIGVEVDHPDVVHLIPEAGDAGFEALRKRGHYPINHLIVVRDDVLQNYDNVAPIPFDVFAEAKNRYVAKLRDGTIARPDANDLRYRRIIEVTGADPLPYGIGPNRAMIDELIRHAVNQHILAEPPLIETLFA
jgi:4,5-dihydroxyphthalate decarboxylase